MSGSIWTRDLLDNPFGRVVVRYVAPIGILASGVVPIIFQEARWKGYDYHGFDAVCIGVGLVCVGGGMLAFHHLPMRSAEEAKRRTAIVCGFSLVFIIAFGTALFRNI